MLFSMRIIEISVTTEISLKITTYTVDSIRIDRYCAIVFDNMKMKLNDDFLRNMRIF